MRRVHFIGIGGYSMSGLALWLKAQGDAVTGSDMTPSSRTERLLKAGIPVFFGHDPRLVAGSDYVVYNSDVHEDNPERRAAAAAGIDLRHRSEVLAEVLSRYRTVSVSGTHGKTTTTTMIGTVLVSGGWDPTVLVGGEVPQFGGNLRLGAGAWAVAEADESDGTFLRYSPEIAVATNIEPEHLDHFQNRFDGLVGAFRQYLSRVPRDGLAVVGVDNPVLAQMAKELPAPVRTYGLVREADLRAERIRTDPQGTIFQVWESGTLRGTCRMPVPGRHNVANALAAVAAARHLGMGWSEALAGLEGFQNANRRFQIIHAGPIRVVDDYAHHPSEIAATVAAARQVTGGRVMAVFQPQRYSRTRALWNEFARAFGGCDYLYLTEIYSPPGDPPIAGIGGEALAAAVRAETGGPVQFVADMFDAVDPLLVMARPGDTILTMGAGNVFRVAEALARRL
ncbi:MAG: UDP-N-acetylmuramate--L-alanine ligase [Thermaerobacter sp.]|nr:UDP-N-acetylmuramate--L-alanine ligase [Thermaerobacter sp.]